ncbi:hypothetical protein RUND412_000331 [Rhizina undulata]
MQKFIALAAAFSGLIASAAGHGYIVSPPRRYPGAAMEEYCGQTIYNNQESDNAGPIQLLLQSASTIVNADECHLWLCKGYQFADNTANVQTYSLGETVPFEVKIIAPHTGYANVSIVNTASNSVIGSALATWDVYASTSTGVAANDTSFSVTIPEDLEGCTTAGECVLQWFWYAPPSVDQTYESCVDFIIGDGTTASSSSSATQVATTTAAATTAPAETTTPVAAMSTESGSTVVEETTISSIPVATTTSTTAVVVPTTSSVATPIATSSVAAPKPVSSSAVVVSSKAAGNSPTTLVTKTRAAASSSAVAPAASSSSTCYTTSEAVNKCLDAVNVCIANAQSKTGGAVDFSACESQRAYCTMC